MEETLGYKTAAFGSVKTGNIKPLGTDETTKAEMMKTAEQLFGSGMELGILLESDAAIQWVNYHASINFCYFTYDDDHPVFEWVKEALKTYYY